MTNSHALRVCTELILCWDLDCFLLCLAESLLTQVALKDARAGNDMAATVEFKRGQVLPEVVGLSSGVVGREVKSVVFSGENLFLRNDSMLSLW